MLSQPEARLFIDGHWVEGKSHFPVINPYTGEEIVRVASAGRQDVEAAVKDAVDSGMDSLAASRRYQNLQTPTH